MANKRIQLGSVDLSGVENKHRWYPVVTLYNHEENFAKNLKEAVTGTTLEHLVSEIYVPVKLSKEMVKLKDGTTKPKIHRQLGAYSSYVFVRCILTETLWNMLRSTTGVAVILSTGGIPSPLTDEEVRKIKEQQKPEGYSNKELQKLAEDYKKNYVITEIDEDDATVGMNVDQKIEYAIENGMIICTPDRSICKQFLERISNRKEFFGYTSDEECESIWNVFKHNTAFTFNDNVLKFTNKTNEKSGKVILTEFDFAVTA